jgi:hypothetical protein
LNPPADAWPADPDVSACDEHGRENCEEHIPVPDADVGTDTRRNGARQPTTPRPALTVHRALDLINVPRPAVVIEGMAWAGRLTVLVAPSGDGKTFVLLDAAGAVTDGVPWHGRTTRHGSVLYVSFEGDAFGVRLRALTTGAGRRIEHLHVAHAADPLSPRVTRDGEEQRSVGESDLVDAIDALVTDLHANGRPPLALIIVDTVRASLAGSEDNSEHVAAYLRAVRRIMSSAPGAAAILAHHAGWQDGDTPRKRERGSSAWRGNCDATLYLEAGEYDAERGEAPLVLRALKVRDSERPAPLRLLRRRVELADMLDPADVRRGPVTSCVIGRDSRTLAEREADDTQARDAAELAVDRKVLRLLVTRPDLSTSQDRLRVALALKRDVVQAALARLIRRAWVVPPERQRQPYAVTPEGRIADAANDEL